MPPRHMFGAQGFSAMAGRRIPLRGLGGWIQPLKPPPTPTPAPTPTPTPTECPEGQILVDGACQPAPSAAQVTTPPAPTPEPTPTPTSTQVSTPIQQPPPISTAPQPQPIPISTMPQPQPISTAPQPQSIPISTMPQPIQTVPPLGPEGILVQIPPVASVPSPCDAGAWLRSKPALGQVRLRRGIF